MTEPATPQPADPQPAEAPARPPARARSGRFPSAGLRVSDAEREHVVGLLHKATGQGLITLDEFTERTDTALAAKTRAELNVVLVDLPGVVHRDSAPAPQQVELRSTMSSLTRAGRWVVPRELIVRNRAGSTELDFTEARFDHPEVRVELDVTAGSVRLLVPERGTANTDGVTMFAGSVKNRAQPDGMIGTPHIVVRGEMRAGSLEVRRPKYVRIGSLVIRFPWKVFWDK